MQPTTKIGNTPLVNLGSFNDLEVYAKLEYRNPTGSIKDRIAFKMIEDAEHSGLLRTGMEIIEVSSGNTGISLSKLGMDLGYSVTIVSPIYVTEDSKRLIRQYNGKIIEVNGYFKDCYDIIEGLMREKPGHYYCPHQTANISSLISNEDLGREVLNQLNNIHIFLASIGTGSTLTGIGRVLKERNPDTRIYAVLPDGEYSVPGVDDYKDTNFDLPLLDKAIIDNEIKISEREAIEYAKELKDKYGHYVGISSGAVFAAVKKVSSNEKGNAIIIFPDRGDRYKHILG